MIINYIGIMIALILNHPRHNLQVALAWWDLLLVRLE